VEGSDIGPLPPTLSWKESNHETQPVRTHPTGRWVACNGYIWLSLQPWVTGDPGLVIAIIP